MTRVQREARPGGRSEEQQKCTPVDCAKQSLGQVERQETAQKCLRTQESADRRDHAGRLPFVEWSFLRFFLTLMLIELVSQVPIRLYRVTQEGGWGKELALALGTGSHSRNLALVPEDDESTFCHDTNSLAESHGARHSSSGLLSSSAEGEHQNESGAFLVCSKPRDIPVTNCGRGRLACSTQRESL
jgi:hypothetical protein